MAAAACMRWINERHSAASAPEDPIAPRKGCSSRGACKIHLRPAVDLKILPAPILPHPLHWAPAYF